MGALDAAPVNATKPAANAAWQGTVTPIGASVAGPVSHKRVGPLLMADG
jgi:hypothetical protein